MKTGGQIELDVYTSLQTSIKTKISGNVYLSGTRPLNASTEDAVISFLTGLDTQIQTGVLNINIFVPDINIGAAQLVKNISRCNEIEAFMLALIEEWSVKSEYKFSLNQTILTLKDEEIEQHFVNVKLKYKRLSI